MRNTSKRYLLPVSSRQTTVNKLLIPAVLFILFQMFQGLSPASQGSVATRETRGNVAAYERCPQALPQDDYGYIQIKCAPGLKVFLDDDYVGNTNVDDGGLVISEVMRGGHTLRFTKAGYIPKRVMVTVERGKVALIKVDSLIVQIEITETGEAATVETRPAVGWIIVRTFPVECRIDAALLGLQGRKKTKREFRIDNVPVGSYAFRFSAPAGTVEATVRVDLYLDTVLFVDFTKGRVTDISRRRRDAWISASSPDSAGIRFSRVHGTAYEMSITEITQAQLVNVMGGKAQSKRMNFPARVKKEVALRFCQRLSEREGTEYSLPSSSLWRTAMMAGASTQFWFGDDRGKVRDFEWERALASEGHPVGTREPNAWGFFDMCGNASEWVSDTIEAGPTGPAQEAFMHWRGDPSGADPSPSTANGVWTEVVVTPWTISGIGIRVVRPAKDHK